ncbi:MAG TPA: YbbR-like domain-containing protein [Candidatus Omnitrophota bacterium]|mgnify:CR=1 FL=1|nr:YbbR-like domain-containing protein [Candidatus Omnitrophota bacterium]HPS21128.1 YbbR-like domain-containing protein [Candidatus Omnitrophota bacterium]
MKIFGFLTNNIWAKIVSLIFAIITWFYILDIMDHEVYAPKKEGIENLFTRYHFIVKEVPVRPSFAGTSPEGYRVVSEKIKMVPSTISILGPELVLDKINELRTDKIDLSGHTRSVTLRLGVHSNSKFLRLNDRFVDVFLPVEKLVSQKQ